MLNINDRVKVTHPLVKGTPGNGSIVNFSIENNKIFYRVRLDWAVSNVGTLTRVEEHQIQELTPELEFQNSVVE